jgi:hypothetical protein
MADLDLLVDYVSHLEGGLQRADHLTRAGELAQAVWAYLEVLEVDPDNATARQKVGQVVAAVRQFDRTASGRRWLSRMRPSFFDLEHGGIRSLIRAALAIIFLLFIGFSAGYLVGGYSPEDNGEPATSQKIENRTDTLMGN